MSALGRKRAFSHSALLFLELLTIQNFGNKENAGGTRHTTIFRASGVDMALPLSLSYSHQPSSSL